MTEFTDGVHVAACDAPSRHGGQDAGFTPFSLLEASLAGCMNITLRVFARTHDIDLEFVETTVTLKPGEGGYTFEYSIKLPEGLSDKDRKRLIAARKGCPIHGLLGQPLSFELKEE
ncbi:OsmC family protein [Pseudodesulfovibrio mercurii]|uniref:OsmC family protein n=1 Tax=Pseudodesulfovibrio mercurii TaxID=641491 RepID=UPI0006811B3C|nr:OsmC family protein [Pseudodesulfovibrio mercurii]